MSRPIGFTLHLTEYQAVTLVGRYMHSRVMQEGDAAHAAEWLRTLSKLRTSVVERRALGKGLQEMARLGAENELQLEHSYVIDCRPQEAPL